MNFSVQCPRSYPLSILNVIYNFRKETWISVASCDISASLPRSFCSAASNSSCFPIFACINGKVSSYTNLFYFSGVKVIFHNSYQPSGRLWNEEKTQKQNCAWDDSCKQFLLVSHHSFLIFFFQFKRKLFIYLKSLNWWMINSFTY